MNSNKRDENNDLSKQHFTLSFAELFFLNTIIQILAFSTNRKYVRPISKLKSEYLI